MAALVTAERLSFAYGGGQRTRRRPLGPLALDRIDVAIEAGSSVGIVGGSGSGKSTLVRVLCGLLPAADGEVRFAGRDLGGWLAEDPAGFRRANQLVFQSPASAFDPRMRIGRSLREPVKAIERRTATDAELADWLAGVGLGPEVLARYPHQLSGGQLQRIAIARALSLHPRVLYADEPTSSLDVSVQAQVLNLLMARRDADTSLVLVSHDLAVVAHVCEQLIVMEDGRVVEAGSAERILADPASEAARRLIAAADAVSLA
jgi:ABC-type dipeptide/oligopeptide/nickel transport system ATPase subunit